VNGTHLPVGPIRYDEVAGEGAMARPPREKEAALGTFAEKSSSSSCDGWRRTLKDRSRCKSRSRRKGRIWGSAGDRLTDSGPDRFRTRV
jgi:hypothetical protein